MKSNPQNVSDAVVEKIVHIKAPPETVFDYFCEPELMLKWQGIEAELEPQPGGVYRVQMDPKNVALGKYLEIDRPRRVVFSFGWVGGENVPPEASRVEITLSPDESGEGTHLRLAHFLLPEPQRHLHKEGWDFFVGRLVVAAEGGDPGPYRENGG
ncbi:MAG: SRPBCC domain-containing protein [bacterium]|nr:SRPBCC domain-containing protein [bacterium]